jgi:DNA (cytosine-5)-methyltransferase 1
MTCPPTKISFAEQTALFEKCVTEGLNLSAELQLRGLEFDDFRYKSNPDFLLPRSNYQPLDEMPRIPNGIPAISFFAGAGGFDIGFYCAGYDNLASIEINRIFCDTLRHNFPQKLVVGPPHFSGDVRDREEIAGILQTKLGLKEPFEGVFHGGPPCQSFSIAANQRFSKNGENFKRIGFEHSEYGNLLFDYLWFIQTFRPRVFILENVSGFMEMDKGQQVQRAVDVLKDAGYTVTKPQIFNLADFGVPQQRNRFVMVGSRTSHIFNFPKKQKNHIPCIEALRHDLSSAANHETREHKPESLLRYMQLEFGKRDIQGRVDRLNPAKPAKTVIAGGLKGGGRSHLHPFIPRTLSVRESARLQTFPDWYVFTGAIARQFTQVGNAVPPLFACQLAKEIEKQFFSDELGRAGSYLEPTLFEEMA